VFPSQLSGGGNENRHFFTLPDEKIGLQYRTAWLFYNKIMQAMSERMKYYALWGKLQLNDPYLDGEQNVAMPGRGSEYKVRKKSGGSSAFFVFISAWFYAWQRPASSWMVLVHIWWFVTSEPLIAA
jgi:hypothetical protein